MAFCSHVHGMNHDITPSYGGVKIDQTLTRDDMAAPASAVGAIKKRLDGIEDAVDAAAAYANTAASSANTAALEADKAAKRVDASIDSANAAVSAAIAATENAYSRANAATEAAGNANAAAANVNAKAAIAEKAAESANTAADNAKAAAASALSAAENVNVPIAGANSAAQNAESAAKAANAAAENANNAAASASVSAASADAAAQTADEAGRNANAGAKDAVSAAQQASTAAQRANEAAEKAESYESIESARASAEAARENAEMERIEAETARASAELQRAETFAGYQEEIGSLKGDVYGYRIEVPAKYFRLEFNQVWNAGKNAQSMSASAAEVRFFDSDGAACAVESVTADSEYSTSHVATNVLDENLNTFWSSKDVEGAVHTLDFTMTHVVLAARVGIVLRDDLENGLIDELTVKASEDGNAWTEVLHISDEKDNWQRNTWRFFDLNTIPVYVKSLDKRISKNEEFQDTLENNYAEANGTSVQISEAAAVPFKSLVVAPTASIENAGNLENPVSIGCTSGVTLTYPDGSQDVFDPDSRLYWFENPFNPVVRRDWVRRKDTLRIAHYVFTGDEVFYGNNGIFPVGTPSYELFRLPVDNYGYVNSRCTHYKAVQKSFSMESTEEDGLVSTYGRVNADGTIALGIWFKDTRFSTPDAFRAYLKEQCANGTPVEIAYVTNETFEEDIPRNDIEKFNAFAIGQPECVAENADGCRLDCEWWKEFPTQRYVDWAVALRSGGQSANAGDSYTTPEAFGALGDGYADDTKPIQDALDSGRPVFMGGNYRTTATLILKSGTRVLAPCSVSSSADVAMQFLGQHVCLTGRMILKCKNGILVGGSETCNNIFIDNVHIEFDGVYGMKIDADQKAIYNNSFRNIRCNFTQGTDSEAFQNCTCYGFWLYKPNIEPYTFCNHNVFIDCGAGFCGIGAFLWTYDNQDPQHGKMPMNENEFYSFSPEGCKVGVRLKGYVVSSNFANMRVEDFGDNEIIQLFGFCALNRFEFTNSFFEGSIAGYDYMRDQASGEYIYRLTSVFANYLVGKIKTRNAWGIQTHGRFIIAPDQNGGAILVPQSPVFDAGYYILDGRSSQDIFLEPRGVGMYAFGFDTFSTGDDYTGDSMVLRLTNEIWWPIKIIVKPGTSPIIVKDPDGKIVFRLKDRPTAHAVYTLHIREYGRVEYITKQDWVADELDLTE